MCENDRLYATNVIVDICIGKTYFCLDALVYRVYMHAYQENDLSWLPYLALYDHIRRNIFRNP